MSDEDNYTWSWVYLCVRLQDVTQHPPPDVPMARHLARIITAQAYELFDLEDRCDAGAHIIVGTQSTGEGMDACVVVGLMVNVHAWESIVTLSVVENWRVFGVLDIDDFLEIRQSYDDFVSTVVFWECTAVRRMEDFVEVGFPLND